MKEDGRSAIWGGATLGLIIGFLLGLFTRDLQTKVIYSVFIGAGMGVIANMLGWISDRLRNH